MNSTFDIATLLDWSEPKTVKTRKGERVLRTAAPDSQFWAAWRGESVKAEMREAGISVGKDNGEWQVCWWSEPERDPKGMAERLNGGPVIQSHRTEKGHDSGTIASSGDVEKSSENSQSAEYPEQSCGTIFKVRRGAASQRRDVASPPSAGSAGLVSTLPVEDLKPSSGLDTASNQRTTRSDGSDSHVPAIFSGVQWSAEQQAIFDWFKSGAGNLVVQARAGTGKTTTIKEAFSHATEQAMLYAVFNKKNQREAAAKITDPRVEIKTLHSLGYSYIRSIWRDAQPNDDVERDRIEAACKNIHDEAVTAVDRLVGFAKNLFVSVPTESQLVELANDRGIFCGVQTEEGEDEYPVARLAIIAQSAMKSAMEKDGASRISFNDMVWLPVAMNWVRPRFDLVVIDECQDMSVPQLFMARHACRKSGRVCVVGDDRQTIYGFRGCAQDGMGMMKRELNAATLPLTTTYRCPKKVVAMAAQIVPDYNAAPEAPEGEILFCNEGELFEKLVVGDAVLSRLNAPLMGICLGLLRKGVSARIEGRDIGKQLCGMVRKLKAKSVPDFLRKLAHWSDKQKARLNVGKNGPAKCATINDQVETLQAVAEGCANVAEIESRLLNLFQDSDENAKPAVVLSSVHKAKGLEWQRTALLSWTFNRGRKGQTPEQAQEERNIYYVALTRSKFSLTLVSEGGKANTVKETTGGAKAGAV